MAESRHQRDRRWLVGLTLILLCVIVFAIGFGAVDLSPWQVLCALARGVGLNCADVSDQQVAIVCMIRLPRVMLAVIVGMALATSGVALQGVVRNPLADPALIGVSGGAALGAVLAIVLGGTSLTDSALGPWVIPMMSFCGALLAMRLALRVARVDGVTTGATLLLAGVGLAALAGAGIGILLYLADDAALRSITFWTLGSLGSATWPLVLVACVPVLFAVVALPTLAMQLDQLALGEAEARHVGIDVDQLLRRITLLTALAVGAAVATSGAIGFVGLVVPYLARAVFGPRHRVLLPACIIGGPLLVVAADLVARTVVSPAEMPIGILTSLAGAPVLLLLVRRGTAGTVLA